MVHSLDMNSYDISQALKTENLTNNDFQEICARLGREPNRTELGMFGVMWSEHCCYRNSKPLLAKFPCLLYTSPSPRDGFTSRMPSSA